MRLLFWRRKPPPAPIPAIPLPADILRLIAERKPYAPQGALPDDDELLQEVQKYPDGADAPTIYTTRLKPGPFQPINHWYWLGLEKKLHALCDSGHLRFERSTSDTFRGIPEVPHKYHLTLLGVMRLQGTAA